MIINNKNQNPNWSDSSHEIFLKILLIIFPDLVLGRFGTINTFFGVAIPPISTLTYQFILMSIIFYFNFIYLKKKLFLTCSFKILTISSLDLDTPAFKIQKA